MMLKKKQGLILLIGYVLCTHISHSQKIILSQEVHWKEKDLYLLNYNKPVIPFLRLVYTNNSTDSLYFYVGTKEVENFLDVNYSPNFLVNINIDSEWKKIIDSLPNWTQNDYVVFSNNIYPFDFQVIRKVCCKTKSRIVSESNEHYFINKLTHLLNYQKKLDDGGRFLQQSCFHNPNKKNIELDEQYAIEVLKELKEEKLFTEKLISDTILRNQWFDSKMYNNCMFLKPGESKFIEYDLTPLFLLKGSYNFNIKQQLLFKSHNKNEFIFSLNKNGYKLYNGKINGLNFMLKIDNISNVW
jgi:hypothetical protein